MRNNKNIKSDANLLSSRAITLISLVITIVILIILASIAIYLSLEENGIFTRAKQANKTTNKQTATEIINLKITNCQINKYAEKQEMPTLQELADTLYEDNEIQYITLESKVANKEKIIVGSNTSIYTKLNEYPYEFEINSNLQLASIDGVKILTSESNNENILYERDSSDNTSTNNLVLNDNISNYKRIKIYYRVGNKTDIKEAYIRDSKLETFITYSTKDIYQGDDYIMILNLNINIIESNLTCSDSIRGLIYEGKSKTYGESKTTNDLVKIDRIIGYKTY